MAHSYYPSSQRNSVIQLWCAQWSCACVQWTLNIISKKSPESLVLLISLCSPGKATNIREIQIICRPGNTACVIAIWHSVIAIWRRIKNIHAFCVSHKWEDYLLHARHRPTSFSSDDVLEVDNFKDCFQVLVSEALLVHVLQRVRIDDLVSQTAKGHVWPEKEEHLWPGNVWSRSQQ